MIQKPSFWMIVRDSEGRRRHREVSALKWSSRCGTLSPECSGMKNHQRQGIEHEPAAHAGSDHPQVRRGQQAPRVRPEVCRRLEIAESTWHRWLAQFGGMKANDAKRLKDLEAENARLKELVANQALDIDMLKKIQSGNF